MQIPNFSFHPTRALSHLLIALVVLGMSPHSLNGQSAVTGAVMGHVTDPSGAMIVGAAITVKGLDNGVTRQAVSDRGGRYDVQFLPPGAYEVDATQSGFGAAKVDRATVEVGNQTTVDFKLQLEQRTTSVNVDAASASILQEQPSVGTVINREFISNLPLNGRSFGALFGLVPGAVLAGGPGEYSINGQRTTSNYLAVDGVAAGTGIGLTYSAQNTAGGAAPSTSILGGTNNLASLDGVEEFKILTSTYAPEYGRSPGGQIAVVTRSGTNTFHGALYDYLRNDALDANNFFANRAGLPKPKERQNDFGGVLGGPIRKDKTFFFFSYEGLRLRQPSVGTISVPTAAYRATLPAVIQPLIAGLPLPNGPATTAGYATFSASYSNPGSLDSTSFRVDHNVSDKLRVFARYSYAPSSLASRVSSLSQIQSQSGITQVGTIGATYVLSPTSINELRLNYTHDAATQTQSLDSFGGAIPPSDHQLFFGYASQKIAQAYYYFPGVNYAVGPDSTNTQRQINVVDSQTFLGRGHQIKVGVDYRHLSPIIDRHPYDLYVTFNTDAALQSAMPSLVIPGAYRTNLNFHLNELSLYAQDTWRLTPRLTLDYGLRWELDPPGTEKNGFIGYSLVGSINNLPGLQLGAPGSPLYKTSYTNFAPRIGASYRLRDAPGAQTIVRGGFGLFYDPGNSGATNGSTSSFTPNASRPYLYGLSLPLTAAELTPPPFSSLTAPYGGLTYDPNYKLPYTLQWNVAIEQGLGERQSISVSYVAAAGRDLQQTAYYTNISTVNPLFNGLQVVVPSGVSNYQSLQTKFERQLSHGLQALISYTWAHSIDNSSQDQGLITVLLPSTLNPNIDRGPSDFDIRHTITGAVTYNLPRFSSTIANRVAGGWSLDLTGLARTAAPVNVMTGKPLFNNYYTGRPDVVPGVPLYVYSANLPGGRGINPAAFAQPPLDASGNVTRQGTAGRNIARGFPLRQMDFAIHREFLFTERLRLQFRAELFNVLNTANLGTPVIRLNNGLFGQATSTFNNSVNSTNYYAVSPNPLYEEGGPRSIQLALKLLF
jgi:Carboxypeptidase regulatory-like domain/TonB dependent receptor